MRYVRWVVPAISVALLLTGGPGAAATPSRSSLCLMLESAARANDLPTAFLVRVIWRESRFDPLAVGPRTRSGAHAQGIAQFMARTAAERALSNPFDPVQALPKAAEYLRDHIPGSKLVVLDAAHIANVELPELYTKSVLEFLRS